MNEQTFYPSKTELTINIMNVRLNITQFRVFVATIKKKNNRNICVCFRFYFYFFNDLQKL